MKPFRNILLIIFTLLTFQVNGQLLPYLADPRDGCDSLLVSFTVFTNLSQFQNPKIKWNFGDLEIDTTEERYIDHWYLSTGQFIPIMTIIYDGNKDSVFRDAGIRINITETPSADFIIYDTMPGSFVREFVHDLTYSEPLIYEWVIEDSLIRGTDRCVYRYSDEVIDTVRLIVTNPESGCSDTVTRIVEVADTLDIPNVFSPNEDNINDHWVVRSNGKTVYSVKIFARTGTLVYQAESPIITWDGRNQSGQEMAADTYFYLIEPVKYKTRFKKTGFVQLYR